MSVSDELLQEMDDRERADLLRRLIALHTQEPAPVRRRWSLPPTAVRFRHRFLVVVTAACVVLIPWIILLGFTLPDRHVATNWTLTWIGFDVGLLGALAATAWLTYRRRQAMIIAAFITGTLLVCDAWFDITTASGGTDLRLGVASALLGELPLATLLFGSAWYLLRLTVQRARTLIGIRESRVRLSQLPLFGVPATGPGADSTLR